jgi:hypothetical protein
MSTSLRELRDRLDAVPGPDVDVADLVRRGEQRRSRRRAAVVAGVAAAVALAVSGATLLTTREHDAAPPVLRPHRTDTNPAPEPAQRRLVYADVRDYGLDGGRADVHVGTSAVDVGVRFSWLDATDDGAVVSTNAGPIFFTDGSTVEQIGTLGSVANGTYRAGGLVRTGHTGSLAAWFDSSDRRAPVLVVYDTGQRRVVARHQVARCRLLCSVQVLVGDRIYWNDSFVAYGQTDLSGASVFDLSEDRDVPGDPDTLDADVREVGRGLVLGRSPSSGRAVISTGFVAEGSLLVADDGRQVFDLTTGTPLVMHLPPSFEDGTHYDLVQWLDDDRFVLLGGGIEGTRRLELLVCSASLARCHLAAPSPARQTSRVVNDRNQQM